MYAEQSRDAAWFSGDPSVVRSNEKYRHIQRHSAVALGIRGRRRKPKAPQNDSDGADVSQHVIEEPSGTVADVSDSMDVLHGGIEEQEGTIRTESWKLRSSKRRRY